MSMLDSAARKTMAMASRRRSISLRKPTRRSSSAATNGARVFPAAVAAAAAGEELMGQLTRSAPSAIPGHTLPPSTRNATRAIPVGGHSGVTFLATSARLRLRRADP